MMIKTSMVALVLIASLLCSIFLSVSPFTNTSSSISSAYRALAFKPTNKNNTAISKPPVAVNHPPVANVGPDQTVNESSKVILVGAAVDPDPNDKLTYSWTQIAGPAVTLNGADTASPTFTAPSNVPSDTQLKFALTAKDDKGAASNNPATVTITVKHINHPPVANAGQDQTVNAGYVVALDGSKSKDPDSDQLAYSWAQSAGPTVKLNDANRPIATFTAPSNITSDTELKFKLTVTDDKNAANAATVKVTDKYVPRPNQPPIANAGTDQTVGSGGKVTLDGSGSKDPDGNITSYSWTQVAGPPVTLNGADTMTTSFTAPTLSNDTTLKFSLTVKDDKGAISQPSTVTVTVIAAPPSITPSVSNQTGNATSMTTTQSNQTNNATANEYLFVKTWGSDGSADGQFSFPADVAVDSSGNVYVADYGNDRIQKFDSNGTFITKLGGEFYNPYDVAVDSSGNVYVDDSGNNRIQKFDSNGTFITKWGSNGSVDGEFSNPHGVAVDSSGNVYVADNGNDRIQKFDSNGTFITKWGSTGTGDGQFSGPHGVAVDSSGNVYVADGDNNRIQKFDSNGTFITKWGSTGTGDGQFSGPHGVAVDSSGNVYVADNGNNRIQVFARSR